MADHHASVFSRIWRPFIFLFLITILEFIIAFTITDPDLKTFKNWTFIILTLVKAFYIVAFFMHLKFERMNLGYTIILPLAFVIYLIALMMNEGHAVNTALDSPLVAPLVAH